VTVRASAAAATTARAAAFAGDPGRVGAGVVQVAVDRTGAAAGRGAGRGAGADQVLEGPARDVPVLAVPAVAGVFGDRAQGKVQPP
jgi:hypothetical protein